MFRAILAWRERLQHPHSIQWGHCTGAIGSNNVEPGRYSVWRHPARHCICQFNTCKCTFLVDYYVTWTTWGSVTSHFRPANIRSTSIGGSGGLAHQSWPIETLMPFLEMDKFLFWHVSWPYFVYYHTTRQQSVLAAEQCFSIWLAFKLMVLWLKNHLSWIMCPSWVIRHPVPETTPMQPLVGFLTPPVFKYPSLRNC